MLDVVSQWVAHYGYVLVAVFLLIEAAGVPIPGETALVTAAALAGRGTLSIVGVIIAGCIGTIARRTRRLLDRRFAADTPSAHAHGKWVG